MLDDIGADAAKTGMLFSQPLIEAVADELAGAVGRGLPLVVDPVMVASSGSRLLRPDAVGALTGLLFPLAAVVTPNLPEAQALTGMDTQDRRALAERLVAMGAGAALVTGGHGAEPVDHLFDGREHLRIPVPRHGIAATPRRRPAPHSGGARRAKRWPARPLAARGRCMQAAMPWQATHGRARPSRLGGRRRSRARPARAGHPPPSKTAPAPAPAPAQRAQE